MPLAGNLSEFPLPEVLLLIGSRTGRLRLFDAPEVIPVAIDLAEGQAHALHVADSYLTERAQIVAELSFIVETGDGKFEFASQPVAPVERDEDLPINELVMLLVLHVDEKLAKQRALLAPQLFYMLETPAPEIRLELALNLFFHQSKQLLAGGVRAEDLAEYLGLEETMVQQNLAQLHELGFVKLQETADVETLRQAMLQHEITQKSDEFQLAAEASDLIRRTGKLLKLPTVN